MTLQARVDYAMALEAAKGGDKSQLIALLRSNRPISKELRTLVADVLDGRYDRGKGKPPTHPLLLRLRRQQNPLYQAAEVIREARRGGAFWTTKGCWRS